ncbi:hypothetical protein HPB48_025735 [Haemaphysalis longicornis]|uniref:Tick transposon n=1 Tax=Haemaphysalis longicornis TaxID=44386 RepID=A0A9J6HA55_HAELO|nr:hypothetical protein HPB48_025735 [Haemaphysalis longicornis]
MVESLWKPALTQLKANRRHRRKEHGNFVRTEGGLQLPTDVCETLNLGPKFAVEPRLSPPELLSLVRQVSKRAPDPQSDQCVSAGVDVLRKAQSRPSGLPLKRVERFFKEENLCLLHADKEGGFMVFPEESFKRKAIEAVTGAFSRRDNVSLNKVKSAAKKLCTDLNLTVLAQNIEKSASCSLELFFVAKTHKLDCPLRVIISEHGTWQKCLSMYMYLQRRARAVDVRRPFLDQEL